MDTLSLSLRLDARSSSSSLSAMHKVGDRRFPAEDEVGRLRAGRGDDDTITCLRLELELEFALVRFAGESALMVVDSSRSDDAWPVNALQRVWWCGEYATATPTSVDVRLHETGHIMYDPTADDCFKLLRRSCTQLRHHHITTVVQAVI